MVLEEEHAVLSTKKNTKFKFKEFCVSYLVLPKTILVLQQNPQIIHTNATDSWFLPHVSSSNILTFNIPNL